MILYLRDKICSSWAFERMWLKRSTVDKGEYQLGIRVEENLAEYFILYEIQKGMWTKHKNTHVFNFVWYQCDIVNLLSKLKEYTNRTMPMYNFSSQSNKNVDSHLIEGVAIATTWQVWISVSVVHYRRFYQTICNFFVVHKQFFMTSTALNERKTSNKELKSLIWPIESSWTVLAIFWILFDNKCF